MWHFGHSRGNSPATRVTVVDLWWAKRDKKTRAVLIVRPPDTGLQGIRGQTTELQRLWEKR